MRLQADLLQLAVITILLISVFLFCFHIASKGRVQVVSPRVVHQVQDPGAAHNLGLLHAEGVGAMMRMTAREIQGLISAAKEGDERARAVLYELIAPACTMVAMIIASPLLAMVTVQIIPPPLLNLP